MEPAFEVKDGALAIESRWLFRGISFVAPRAGVTVLLGPGGVGKSALLRTLGARGDDRSRLVEGSFLHRGREIGSEPDEPIVYLPQPAAGTSSDCFLASLDEAVKRALATDADLLVDETVDRLPPETRGPAAEILAGVRGRVAAVVVTHDVGLAERIADHVVLLAGGGVAACGPAGPFFANPPNELARRFLQQGNCWPAAEPPPLPSHFRFIVPGLLAGMGRPGLVGDVDADLEAIALAGIGTLVSLTEQPFPADRLRPFGIAPRHFPIADMGAPAVGPTVRLCGEIDRAMKRGDAVAVHCHAGLGRTGTILAAQLIWRGMKPDEAVTLLRATGRGYVQSDAQERFLQRFADELA